VCHEVEGWLREGWVVEGVPHCGQQHHLTGHRQGGLPRLKALKHLQQSVRHITHTFHSIALEEGGLMLQGL